MLSVAGERGNLAVKTTLGIMFRNSFNINQRYYLENVRWALTPGSFYHDEAMGQLFYWPDGSTRNVGCALCFVLCALCFVLCALCFVLCALCFACGSFFFGCW